MPDGSVQTRLCAIQLDPRGFIRATMRQGALMEHVDAQEALAATGKLAGGKRLPVLVDIRGLKYQTREAREEFVSENAASFTAAVALLVGSPVSRMIGNFFLRHGNHRTPTQLFSQETVAISWLMDQVRS